MVYGTKYAEDGETAIGFELTVNIEMDSSGHISPTLWSAKDVDYITTQDVLISFSPISPQEKQLRQIDVLEKHKVYKLQTVSDEVARIDDAIQKLRAIEAPKVELIPETPIYRNANNDDVPF